MASKGEKTVSAPEQCFLDIYKSVDAYALAKAGKARLRSKGIFIDALTYGEIQYGGFHGVLDQLKAGPRRVFIDIGSGSGRAVILASMFGFDKAIGYEILDELHEAALTAKEKYYGSDYYIEGKRQETVEFVIGDSFSQDWTVADVMFAPCTCFTDEMMIKMQARICTLKPGTQIITTTRKLDGAAASHVKQIYSGRQKYANGTLQWYIYEKVGGKKEEVEEKKREHGEGENTDENENKRQKKE